MIKYNRYRLYFIIVNLISNNNFATEYIVGTRTYLNHSSWYIQLIICECFEENLFTMLLEYVLVRAHEHNAIYSMKHNKQLEVQYIK